MGDSITIFFNIQTRCSKCEDIHPAKVEITEAELLDLLRNWTTCHEGDIEVYRSEKSFMVTINKKVIQDYERSVGDDIELATRVD